MPSRTDRLDFGPPSDAGRMRSFALALLAHAVLIAALTWGVSWKRSDSSASFSAELWSSTAQQAAPALSSPPPPPPAPPTPPATPPPVLTPPPVVAPPPPAPRAPAADIALEDEKKRKLLKQKLEREQEEKQDKRQAAADAKADKELQLKQEKLQAQVLAKQQAASDAKKLDAAKVEAKNKAAAIAANAAANAAAIEAQRKQNLARTLGMAGATGDENATGTAKVSSGPSSSYGGKVRAKVKPNIVFTDTIDGNPKAEVEVRSALDGTIMSQRLVKTSGNKAWDDAVIKAIVRTESMPRDTDGRVPTVMILELRPRD